MRLGVFFLCLCIPVFDALATGGHSKPVANPHEAGLASKYFVGNLEESGGGKAYVSWIKQAVKDLSASSGKRSFGNVDVANLITSSLRKTTGFNNRKDCDLQIGVTSTQGTAKNCCLAGVKDIGSAIGFFDTFPKTVVAKEFPKELPTHGFTEVTGIIDARKAPEPSIVVWNCDPEGNTPCSRSSNALIGCGHIVIKMGGNFYSDKKESSPIPKEITVQGKKYPCTFSVWIKK